MLPRNDSLCDEIFQQTWIKAIDNLKDYRHSDKFAAWLVRISHNLAMDYFRKSSKENIEDMSLDSGRDYLSSYETPSRQLSIKEMRESLDFCISKLPSDQREVFLLRADDIAFREISEIQECSINTAITRMQYALKSLRLCLKNRRGEK